MRTQIFLASSLYGAVTLAAALDAGCFAAADRRILLVSNNAAVPETVPALDAMTGFAELGGRFDRVLSWNETIRPLHPSGWSPRADEVPLWERHLRLLWGLGDTEVALVVESLQVNPAQALCRLFPDAPIEVYADGLMSYGPTRNRLDPLLGTRVRRLLHLDLLPGLRPLLLAEFGVAPEVVPMDAFTAVLAEVATSATATDAPTTGAAALPGEGAEAPGGEAPALLLGQYLSALDILTPEEEERLHLRMLRGAADLGHRRVVFKPHPVAPPSASRALQHAARDLGVELRVHDAPVLAEVLFQRLRPALVVGCFSTALLTAVRCYGLPVARVGTELLLERLTPYQNSNRIPVTLVDAALPDLEDPEAVRRWSPPDERWVDQELHALLRTVGFTMQSGIHPDLRATAEHYLERHLGPRTARYFKRRRLAVLGLPGGVPQRLAFIPRNRAVRNVARRARRLQRTVRR